MIGKCRWMFSSGRRNGRHLLPVRYLDAYRLISSGDRIALLLPTFAPYLEIPKLPHYAFDVVRIKAQRVTTGDRASYVYPQAEIEKLRDPKVKAAFLVNPSNPTANAMGLENISQIEAIVNTDRPDLMILTDDVYGTFCTALLILVCRSTA